MTVSSMRVLAGLVFAGVVSGAAACGGGGSKEPTESSTPAPGGGSPSNVSMNKADYPVFPDADKGADPTVPAEQGGKGFTGEGWETNTDFDLIGDPRAVKGGRIREYQLDFPTTVRDRGPNTTIFGRTVEGLVFESLLGMHPTSLDYIPALATHWQISPDKKTYRFRIDPNARWADGQPVVAEDVVATWRLMRDKGLQDPSAELVYSKFEQPVAESNYIVRVESKVLNWRNFLYFSGMMVYPAHVLKNVDGARYIKEYNYKVLPGSGPYTLREADVVKGKNIVIRRRNDYWAEKQRRNVGTGNFDEIHEIVVRDQNLAFEMFKKGDLDYYYVNISRQWVEEMNFDRVQRGLIQKRKIFNDNPTGLQAFAFNTRREPWNDIRVRQALTHLLNRKLLIEKLYFNEYMPKQSFFDGAYANKSNPANDYDPQKAIALLAEAGWKDRDAQGRLVRNGRPLQVEILYGQKATEPALTIYQEDLRKLGIGLTLRLVTFETMIQLVDQRKFDVVSVGYSGLTFPNPETQFHSSLADQDNNNNITGFKSPRVDELLVAYDREYDQAKREAIIREIDGIVAKEHHFILEWDAPFQRIGYWNRFGHPEGYLSRTGDYRDILSLWWFDAQKEQQITKTMADPAAKLAVGQTDVRYWQEFAKRQGQQPASSTAN